MFGKKLFTSSVFSVPKTFISGYGISAESTRTVAEGIAYLYYSSMPAYSGDPETNKTRSIGGFGEGTLDPFEILLKASLLYKIVFTVVFIYVLESTNLMIHSLE